MKKVQVTGNSQQQYTAESNSTPQKLVSATDIEHKMTKAVWGGPCGVG
jgi:hypothetical protein